MKKRPLINSGSNAADYYKNETVSIKRIRLLSNNIQNELRAANKGTNPGDIFVKERIANAKT